MTNKSNKSRRSFSGSTLFLSAIVAAIVAILIVFFSNSVNDSNAGASSKLSTLDRVIQTGVIRAGYLSNPPSCIIDPNTSQVSGVIPETFERIAEKASLKVEWVEEVGFGSMIEGLNTDRYDAVPCGIWVIAERALKADFTKPLYYSGIGVYVRSDETRFDQDLSLINSPDVRIATLDGEVAQSIANTTFPKAQQVSLPQLSEISTMLLNVETGKADVAFVEYYFASEFLRNNPGSLKNLAPDKPFRIFPNTILVRTGDNAFRRFLDNALGEVINLGIVDELLKKYEPEPGTFYRTVLPYQLN